MRTSGRASTLAAAALALALAAGCGETTSGSDAGTAKAGAAKSAADVRIYYIVKAGTAPYFVNEARGVREQAAKLGAKATVVDVKGDANATLSAVDTAVTSGASGILIVVPDQKLGPAVLQKSKAAGIPMIALNDSIKDSTGKTAPFIGFDAADLGTQMGTQVAKYYQQAGSPKTDVAIVSLEQPKLSVCNDRTEAAEKAFLRAVPGFDPKNIVHLPYEDSLDSGLNAMGPVVTSKPRIKTWLLWGCNDDGVYGAVKALQNNGVSKDAIWGVGLGGAFGCDALVKSPPSGFRATVNIDSAAHGVAGVDQVVGFATKGTAVQESIIKPGVLVTREDAAQKLSCA